MGAWGVSTFHNDTACDWKCDLEEDGGLQFVESTLEQVIAQHDESYIDADVGSSGLAACEVIARLHGRWGIRDSYSASLDEWVVANPQKPSTYLIELAVRAIEAILSQQSELREMWEDSGLTEAWTQCVLDLKHRVVADS